MHDFISNNGVVVNGSAFINVACNGKKREQ